MTTRPAFRWLLFAGFLSLHGCLNPNETTLPSWQTGPPAVENLRYQLHDPFPDRVLGPDTMVRPRGYDRQRAEARQAKENRMPGGVLGGFDPLSPPPANGPSSWQYPETVPY